MDFRIPIIGLQPTPTSHTALALPHQNQSQRTSGPSAPVNPAVATGSSARSKSMQPAHRVVVGGDWPFGRIDTRAPNIHLMRARWPTHQPETIGRPMPKLTPQSVGRYFQKPVGEWQTRLLISKNIERNLAKLQRMQQGSQREQLHLEITLHWHCLSELEKVQILENLGTKYKELLGQTGEPASNQEARTPVRDFLEHTLSSMKPAEAKRLFNFCSLGAKETLKNSFDVATIPALRATIKERHANLRNTMPLDHGYDYTGYIWDNNRQIATIPDDRKGIRVRIFGGATAGLTFADFCNRAGMTNVKVMEQAPEIGGRLKTVYWPNPDREDEEGRAKSPTPLHPGGMRFHQTRGNVYWSYAEHYKLAHVPFPNPSKVSVTGLLGDELHMVRPGGHSDSALVNEVLAEFKTAFTDRISTPVRDTRDAADSGTFFELCDKLKGEFDSHALRAAVELQLNKAGIKWPTEKWDVFNALGGFGVGGYKGYNSIGSLEEFRFIIDERLEDHVCLVQGADEPLRRLLADTEGLPEGQTALADHVETNVELLPGAYKRDGLYHLPIRNKITGEETMEVCEEFFFTGSPAEAQRLGLTNPPKPGDEPILANRAFASAVEQLNMVDATKMILKIPRNMLEGLELPENIQTSHSFGQSYILPPIPGSNSVVVYPSYLLGNSASKMVGLTGEEQLRMFIDTLRDLGRQKPEDPEHQKLVNLADVVERAQEKSGGQLSFTHWSKEPHLWGAFKGDMPGDLAHTETVFMQAFKPESAVCFGEQYTSEFGFASGAVVSSVNVFGQMAERLGGKKKPNAPTGLAPSNRQRA